MSAPVVPNDFKELISDPTASLCGNFINTLLKLPLTLWKLVNFMFDTDGNLSADFKTQISEAILPPGAIVQSLVFLDAPDFLICDGAIYPVATYPTLGALLTNVYGGDGSTTFGIPDMRDKFIVGVSGTKTIAATGGEETHMLTQAELPATELGIKSTVGDGYYGSTIPNGGAGPAINAYGLGVSAVLETLNKAIIAPPGGGLAHNNLPPYRTAYIYVKT